MKKTKFEFTKFFKFFLSFKFGFFSEKKTFANLFFFSEKKIRICFFFSYKFGFFLKKKKKQIRICFCFFRKKNPNLKEKKKPRKKFSKLKFGFFHMDGPTTWCLPYTYISLLPTYYSFRVYLLITRCAVSSFFCPLNAVLSTIYLLCIHMLHIYVCCQFISFLNSVLSLNNCRFFQCQINTLMQFVGD